MLTSRHTEPLYKRSVLLKNPDVFHLKKKKILIIEKEDGRILRGLWFHKPRKQFLGITNPI